MMLDAFFAAFFAFHFRHFLSLFYAIIAIAMPPCHAADAAAIFFDALLLFFFASLIAALRDSFR